MFIPLGILSPKVTTFSFLMLKLLCKIPGQRLVSLTEVGIVVVAFLVEYIVAVVVGKDLVEVVVAADADDLTADGTAAAVVVVALTNFVFDDDYVVCGAVDVVAIAGLVVFVVVAVDAAGVPAVFHIDAKYLSNNLRIDDVPNFCVWCMIFMLCFRLF